ncbi:response regulator [Candidatus Woesebacteria bacterium]|nr:response regulator [Candidatus Woesebacteria bacterium]
MKKILLLEDDRFLIHIYRAKLLKLGYDITMLPNGLNALKTALDMRPDLIVTDIIMPEKDGFAVISEIKAHPETNHIPIIVLTNLSQDADKKKVANLGAEIFLVKADLSFAQVVEQIKKVLGE